MSAGPPDDSVLAKWLRVAQAKCGSFDMRIAADGTWFYHGSPIGRKSLVRLFSNVLYRDDDGAYWLVTPVEQGRIEVDDAPFTAVEVEVTGQGRDQALRFRTNLDDWVAADSRHPIRVVHDPATGEPRPYVLVRGRLEALILRPVFYDLVALCEPRRSGKRTRYGVYSKGAYFVLDAAQADR